MKKFAFLGLLFALCACGGTDQPYDVQDFEQGGPNAPYLNERSMQVIRSDNPYSDVDSFRPISEEEKAGNDAKWNTARKDTRWQEYHGAMIRIEVLLGSSELRQMRLRMVQNANGMDIDGDMREVLSKVAEFEMKRVCGRNAKSYLIVYDRPSFEVVRPTPYFDYQVQDNGSSMREFGFRCLFQ
ncbi:MAG: hypothetical protein FWF97_03875 [Alphaproteobacteria bacterium]|nr:hypothetical protein [Alphaproteobacteria bacterium]